MPAIVGALIQLGRCFDLMDARFTDKLPSALDMLKKLHEAQQGPLPENAHERRNRRRATSPLEAL